MRVPNCERPAGLILSRSFSNQESPSCCVFPYTRIRFPLKHSPSPHIARNFEARVVEVRNMRASMVLQNAEGGEWTTRATTIRTGKLLNLLLL